jgi:hypothetical protein
MEFNKQTAMGLFIVFIMVFAMLGYAFMSTGGEGGEGNIPQIPNIVNGSLEPEEKILVLRTGRVLIEDFYSPDSPESLEKKAMLEGFADRLKDFLVLELVEVPLNETKIWMIGRGGDVVDISNITQKNFMTEFCLNAILQPRECLLKDI